jgi:hypothetical protein
MAELPDNVRALFTQPGAQKARNLAADPRVALVRARPKRVRAKPDQARPDAGLAVRPPSG